MREAGLVSVLEGQGISLEDRGDLTLRCASFTHESRRAQNLAAVVAAARELAEATKSALAASDAILVIGGDCTISLGVLSGALECFDSVGLAYVDAHLDLNTPATSPTGILDSMGVAHAIGHGAQPLAQLGPHNPLLLPEQIVFIGYQPSELNSAEAAALIAEEITAFPADRVSGQERKLAAAAIDQLQRSAERYLVHLDLDVIDFVEFPASDWAQYCGDLDLATAETLLRELVADQRCLGLVVTEFNPDRERDGLAARLVDFLAGCATALSGGGIPNDVSPV